MLAGHCVDLGDVGLPYLPFADLLRRWPADADLARRAGRHPALRGCSPAGPASSPGSRPTPATGRRAAPRDAPPPVDDGRLQLFEAVAALLGRAGRAAAPLLVVLEDLHWADRSSRDLLRFLLARLVDEPVAVVASYRADDLHRRHPLRPLLAELVRLPGVERLALDPLSDADVERLVRELAAESGGRCPPARWRTSSPAPRATRSTPRSCWPPGWPARPCRWG